MQSAAGISEKTGKHKGEARLRNHTLYPVEMQNGKVEDVAEFGEALASLEICFMGCAIATVAFIAELTPSFCRQIMCKILTCILNLVATWVVRCARYLVNFKPNWVKQRGDRIYRAQVTGNLKST